MNATSMQAMCVRLIDMARAAGAVDADAVAICDTSESIRVRHGSLESVEREDARSIGLRVFVEQRDGLAFATAATSDLSDDGLTRLVEQVVTMARISAVDPDAVPPSGADHPDHIVSGTDEPAWTREKAREAALACEEAALSFSDDITNSEGAEAGFGTSEIAYATADGFAGSYRKSSAGIGVSVIAGRGDGMQRDYEFDRQRCARMLRDPAALGQKAAERACRRLGAAGIGSRRTTVVFEPRVAVSLLGHLAAAVDGRAVLQQSSFLAEITGQRIFPAWVNIVDDPAHPTGLGNRPFDGEGTRTLQRTLISDGVLTGFLTDRYAAGRLGVENTGHARRGLTGDISIGPNNLIFQPGDASVEAMLADIGDGLWVTEMMGFGVNGVTGDYSRGAAGFLIEGGRVTRPVQEITIAGNLRDMFAGIVSATNDLTWFGSRAAPTIAVGGMTVAGQQ